MYNTVNFRIPEHQHHNGTGIFCAQNLSRLYYKPYVFSYGFLGGNVIGFIVVAPGIALEHLVGPQ